MRMSPTSYLPILAHSPKEQVRGVRVRVRISAAPELFPGARGRGALAGKTTASFQASRAARLELQTGIPRAVRSSRECSARAVHATDAAPPKLTLARLKIFFNRRRCGARQHRPLHPACCWFCYCRPRLLRCRARSTAYWCAALDSNATPIPAASPSRSLVALARARLVRTDR